MAADAAKQGYDPRQYKMHEVNTMLNLGSNGIFHYVEAMTQTSIKDIIVKTPIDSIYFQLENLGSNVMFAEWIE